MSYACLPPELASLPIVPMPSSLGNEVGCKIISELLFMGFLSLAAYNLSVYNFPLCKI